MDGFKGCAKFSSEEVKVAISNYEEIKNHLEKIIKDKVSQAEEDFKPSWWEKLWGIKSLKEKYKNRNSWTFRSYRTWLFFEGYFTLSDLVERDKDLVKLLCTDYDIDLDLWEEEYKQLKCLINGDPLYLNLKQSGFVGKFKNLKLTKEITQ